MRAAGKGPGPGLVKAGGREPGSGLAKRPMFGMTSGMSLLATPNQRAIVAAYSSTEVVGSSWPCDSTVFGLLASKDGKSP